MVKLTFAPVALVALLAGSAFAQDSSAAPPAPSSSMSESAAPPPSSSAAGSAPAPTSMSSMSGGGGGGGAGGAGGAGASGVCTVLAGKDPIGNCPYSSTSTPPYDFSSLASYLIGSYTRGPEAVEPEEVANEFAGSVAKYYPTLSASRSELKESFLAAIEASITAVRNGEATLDAAPAHLPASLGPLAIAAAAVIAAGAFIL